MNYIIIKMEGMSTKYLRHEGHQHFWTFIRSEAMEYSKLDVAQGLAEKMKGVVSPA